jgi:hypothetical protein
MDVVAALHPWDDFEARLAVRVVAMGAHADDSLRLAGLAAADPMEMRRCRAQAIAMARQADATLRMLQRVQATRAKALAAPHPAAHAPDNGREMHQAEAAQPWPAEPKLTAAEVDAEVERYAVMYPDRAARIRAAGGLPPDLDFGPPEPHIVVGLLRAGDASRAMRHNPGNRNNETERMRSSGSPG